MPVRTTLRRMACMAGASLVALTMTSCSIDEKGAPTSVVAPNSAANISTGQRIVNADAEPQNWLTTGRNYAETRFSPLTEINETNAHAVGLVWFYDLDTQRGQEATPLAVDGVVYTTSAWSKVQAFDPVTGKLLWQFDPKVPGASGVKPCCDVVNRGAAYWNGKVYVGTIDGRLIAVDARSGQQVWSVQTTDTDANNTITGAPRIVKGRVIIGNGGADLGARGYVTAYDAETGHLSWRFYTVPGQPGVKDGAASDEILERLASKTWSGNWWSKAGGLGGGTVWDSMAYDPELDLLYIGAGNAAYWDKAYRSPGDGDNLFVASILALRPETGEYVWHFQEVPGEEWDFTATQHMILADLVIDGKMRKVLMQAPKDGVFYVLDRATGKLISAKPYVPINWAKSIDPDTGRPDIAPEARYDLTGKVWVGKPGGYGGHDWQPMAFNRVTGLVYLPALELPSAYKHDPHFKPMPRGVNVGTDAEAEATYAAAIKEPPKGYLLAWDPARQQEVWRAPSPGVWNGGTLTTAGNLVIQGDSGGFVNIYNAKTGHKLWSFDAQSGIVAAPSTYAADGKQYITIIAGPTAGASTDLHDGGTKGLTVIERAKRSRVLTFALGGGAVLPAPVTMEVHIPQAPAQFANITAIARGLSLYNKTCVDCHGFDAVGSGVIPDLRHSAVLGDKDAWKQIVWDGVLEPTGMVSFKENFSLDEMEAIRAFVISRARAEQKAR